MIADKQAEIDIINAQMQDMTYENVHLIHDFVININNSTPSKSDALEKLMKYKGKIKPLDIETEKDIYMREKYGNIG